MDSRTSLAAAARGIADRYVLLDSFTRVLSSNISRGEFVWNIQVEGTAGARFGGEHTGVAGPIENVVDARLEPFSLPAVSTLWALQPENVPGTQTYEPADPILRQPAVWPPFFPNLDLTVATDAVHSWWSQLPDRILAVELEAFGNQAYRGTGQAALRHHFFYTTSWMTGIDGIDLKNRIGLTPLPEGDRYILARPVGRVNQIALRFTSLDAPLAFLPDSFQPVRCFAGLDTAGLLELQFESPPAVPGGTDGLLQDGDRVYFSDFAFLSSVLVPAPPQPPDVLAQISSYAQKVVAYVSRTQGVVVQKVFNPLPPPVPPNSLIYRLSPTVDLTPLWPAPLGPIPPGTPLAGPFRIWIERLRLALTARLRCLSPVPTNAIVAV